MVAPPGPKARSRPIASTGRSRSGPYACSTGGRSAFPGKAGMRRLCHGLRTAIALTLTLPLVAACGGLIPPSPGSIRAADRLEAFNRLPTPPFERPVEIRWNLHLVPYIIAETDRDGALALGLVHAHLRLGQMEVLKRIARGRISEMVGPFTTEFDAAIRTIGFARAAPEILRRMPPETRAWLDAYVAGINFYKSATDARPPEFSALGIDEEPWTAEDTLALGRLGGMDFTWIVLPELLKLRATPQWQVVWEQLARPGGEARLPASGAEAPARGRASMLTALFRRTARLGSNSIAVAPSRSASGGALIANDPHLGLHLPNTWLMAGLHTPSYRAVGMMAPGLPVFAFGRTPCLAWGGTNLHGWNTDLVDLASHPDPLSEEVHDIGVRFWIDTRARIRRSDLGPVISDAALLEFPPGRTYAARWIGHLPSDEITALLDLLRAPNGRELSRTLRSFAVPAQNIVYADCEGNIGHLVATWLPDRPVAFPPDIFVDAATSRRHWERILTSGELPSIENPETGYVVSANDRAFETPPTRIGLSFSPGQRAERLAHLVEALDPVDLSDLTTMQRDVYSAAAHGLTRLILASAPTGGNLIPDLARWQGTYEAASRGALVYEAVLTHLAPNAFGAAGRSAELAFWLKTGFLDIKAAEVLRSLGEARRRELVAAALAAAAREISTHEVWGDRHRLANRHYLGLIPVLGAGYRIGDLPGRGGRETVLKSGAELEIDQHSPSFGSHARHVSDLGDPDANFFILLGGQDGWFGSGAFDDQIPLWTAGESIQLPLSLDTVRKQFPITSGGADATSRRHRDPDGAVRQ